MAIRLNKVVRELNIGLQTAVDFLMKKSELGEVEANPNFKLNDAQYAALVEEFKKDKEVRNQAAKIFPKKPKEKKKEPESHRAETLLESGRQQVKPLGKIDLANVGRPAPKSEPKPATPEVAKETDAAVAKVEEPVEEKVAQPSPTPVEVPAPEQQPEKPVAAPEVQAKPTAPEKVEKQETPEPPKKPVVVEKAVKEETPEPPVVSETPQQPEPQKVAEKEEEPEAPASAESQEAPSQSPESSKPEIFTLESERTIAPKVNMVGKVNLGEIDQRTRPKKKSKEELRKEREKKAQSQHGGTPNAGQGGEKRKRSRIGKERVDIAAASQNAGQGGQGGGQNSGQGGKNKGKNKGKEHKRPQRPVEVNEEDVAKQVRETLAPRTRTRRAPNIARRSARPCRNACKRSVPKPRPRARFLNSPSLSP